MNTAAVQQLLLKKMAGQSLREFGSMHGLSAAYLSDVLRGNRKPGPAILAILGLEKGEPIDIEYHYREKRRKS